MLVLECIRGSVRRNSSSMGMSDSQYYLDSTLI